MKVLNPVLVALLSGYIVFSASAPASTAEQHKAISRAPAKTAKTFSPETAPTRKEVLRALLQIQDVGLAASPSCSGVGTEPTDSNIGDYISGFLAEQDSSNGGNSIEVSTKDAQGANHERAWRSEVTIRHLDGDDRWGWGVSFLMRSTDHAVIKESVRCIGAG